jgi:hypothetical protein
LKILSLMKFGGSWLPIFRFEDCGNQSVEQGRVVPSAAATLMFSPLARADEFHERNQRDLGRPVLSKKIFRFTCRANHPYKLAPSHPARGAYRDRHETRDEMRWTRRQRKTNAAGRVRQSRVVLTPQWLASSWRKQVFAGDGDNKARYSGEQLYFEVAL